MRRDRRVPCQIFYMEMLMTKTNTQLQQDVLQELKFEPSVDASDIGVTAKDAIVSLTGNVKNYAE